ncbi:MAG: glycosyltransferase family 4 protein [Bacteroidota bacterium]
MPYTLINTQYFPVGKMKVLNPIYTIGKVLLNVWQGQVIFLNCSDKGIRYLSPILYLIAQLFRLKLVIRPFGGDFKTYTSKFGRLQTFVFNQTTLKADLLCLQTKELMEFYQSENIPTFQLPTSRDLPPMRLQRKNRPYQKRFVFLGLVNRSKGIDHLLAANRQLTDDYTIHIYGPIRENYEVDKEKNYLVKFKEQDGIYQGVLAKEEVLETLQKYDVLVLPTFYRGEGYPGAIIEAYSLGLPVITTKWKAIPEIVVDGKTGLLIEPQSTGALVKAIQFFNEKNYPAFSDRAKKHFEESFSTERVTAKAIHRIKALFNE